jgi:hypothetical protein
MRMLLVLGLLPVITIVAWVAAPLLVALHAVFTVAERVRATFGAYGELAFFEIFVVLAVLSFKSGKFFWLGLLPVTIATVVLAGH